MASRSEPNRKVDGKCCVHRKVCSEEKPAPRPPDAVDGGWTAHTPLPEPSRAATSASPRAASSPTSGGWSRRSHRRQSCAVSRPGLIKHPVQRCAAKRRRFETVLVSAPTPNRLPCSRRKHDPHTPRPSPARLVSTHQRFQLPPPASLTSIATAALLITPQCTVAGCTTNRSP